MFGNHQSALKASRLESVLNLVDNIVMLCDTTPENKIFYMNNSAIATLNKYHSQLQKTLPGADLNTAMGNSIHQFHKDPNRIRRILNQMSSGENANHVVDKIMGEEICFQTRTFPIWHPDKKGELLCYMACWSDVSSERALERAQKALTLQKEGTINDKVSAIAVALEEMSATVAEIATSSQIANSNASSATEITHHSKSQINSASIAMREVAQRVRETSQIISDLGHQSEEIDSIVSSIKSIAEQTNLLALNAAIEAARAGNAGRGFAVVADEVRQLAERSRSAATEITQKIKTIRTGTAAAVTSIDSFTTKVIESEALSLKADEALMEILDNVGSVADMITQIAAAAEEQSATSADISRNLNHILANTRNQAREKPSAQNRFGLKDDAIVQSHI